MKKAYFNRRREPDEDLTIFPSKKHGRPRILGSLEDEVRPPKFQISQGLEYKLFT